MTHQAKTEEDLQNNPEVYDINSLTMKMAAHSEKSSYIKRLKILI